MSSQEPSSFWEGENSENGPGPPEPVRRLSRGIQGCTEAAPGDTETSAYAAQAEPPGEAEFGIAAVPGRPGAGSIGTVELTSASVAPLGLVSGASRKGPGAKQAGVASKANAASSWADEAAKSPEGTSGEEVLVTERQLQQEQDESRSAVGCSSGLSSPAAKSRAGTGFAAPSTAAGAERGVKKALAETAGKALRDEIEAEGAARGASGAERERGASSTDSTIPETAPDKNNASAQHPGFRISEEGKMQVSVSTKSAGKSGEGETAPSLPPSLASAVRDYAKTGTGGVASSAPARQTACPVQRGRVARAASGTKIAESRTERHGLFPAFPSPVGGGEREKPLLVCLLSAVGEEALCHLYNAELRAKLGQSGPGRRKASPSLPPPGKAKKRKFSLCSLTKRGSRSVAIETPCIQSMSSFWGGEELEHCSGPPIPGRPTPGTAELIPVSAAPLGAVSETGKEPGGQHCTAGPKPGATPAAALGTTVSVATETTEASPRAIRNGTVPLRASTAPPKRAGETVLKASATAIADPSTNPGEARKATAKAAPTAKTLPRPTAGGGRGRPFPL